MNYVSSDENMCIDICSQRYAGIPIKHGAHVFGFKIKYLNLIGIFHVPIGYANLVWNVRADMFTWKFGMDMLKALFAIDNAQRSPYRY